MKLAWAAASDPGRVRANNEDAAAANDRLFIVADGVGGHAAGEVASRIAVETIQSHIGDGIAEAVRLANRAVFDRAGDDPSTRGMGTTISALAVVDDPDGVTRAHVVNVGDSRVYLLRDGDLEQVTVDHNLVSELEREGQITHAEAKVHPQRNIITRVVGGGAEVDVDEFPIDPFKGDRFLLSTDGLFDEIDDDEIAVVLKTVKDPQVAADELVARALAAGGRDNVTVVIVDVLDDDDRAATASAALAGSAQVTSVALPVPPPLPSGHDDRPTRAVEVTRTERRRRLTWRSALFMLVLLLILAGAGGATWWFARGSYYVGFRSDEVTIFRGRPGGVLWFDPTVEQRTGVKRADVAPDRQADIAGNKEEATLADAKAFVRNATTTTTTTSTTTSTTTTTGAPPP